MDFGYLIQLSAVSDKIRSLWICFYYARICARTDGLGIDTDRYIQYMGIGYIASADFVSIQKWFGENLSERHNLLKITGDVGYKPIHTHTPSYCLISCALVFNVVVVVVVRLI